MSVVAEDHLAEEREEEAGKEEGAGIKRRDCSIACPLSRGDSLISKDTHDRCI